MGRCHVSIENSTTGYESLLTYPISCPSSPIELTYTYTVPSESNSPQSFRSEYLTNWCGFVWIMACFLYSYSARLSCTKFGANWSICDAVVTEVARFGFKRISCSVSKFSAGGFVNCFWRRRIVMAEGMKQKMKHEMDFSIRGSNSEVVTHSGSDGEHLSESSIVLVLLNYRLPRFTPRLWSQACKRVCADGGANRLYDELPQFLPGDNPDVVRHSYTPDVIIGDLDSVRADVKDHYLKLGATIVDESKDQDTTDLHKCLHYVRDCTPGLDKSKLKVLVVGALGGRFDHEAANINALWTFANSLRIVLLCEETSLLLLPTGYKHEIHVNESFEGPHCGLVPIGAPSLSTTTTGLRWDLSIDLTKLAGVTFEKLVTPVFYVLIMKYFLSTHDTLIGLCCIFLVEISCFLFA